jgi:hypothetical protein
MEVMPLDIRRYIYLQIFALVISIPPLLFANVAVVSVVARLIVQISAFLVTVAVFVVLLWLVAWRRKNWAKWLCIVLYIASIPVVFFESPYYSTIMDSLNWAATIAAGLSYVFLFTKDGRRWFQN